MALRAFTAPLTPCRAGGCVSRLAVPARPAACRAVGGLVAERAAPSRTSFDDVEVLLPDSGWAGLDFTAEFAAYEQATQQVETWETNLDSLKSLLQEIDEDVSQVGPHSWQGAVASRGTRAGLNSPPAASGAADAVVPGAGDQGGQGGAQGEAGRWPCRPRDGAGCRTCPRGQGGNGGGAHAGPACGQAAA